MERNWRLYQKLAQRILREDSVAEDARQQAFLKAWQRPAHRRQVGRLRPWLSKIVRNESLQVLRKRRSEFRALGYRAASAKKIHSTIPSHDLRCRVNEALENLPEPRRSIVRMRVFDGMSGNEVARHFDCTVSEVSAHYQRGLETLRAILLRDDLNA